MNSHLTKSSIAAAIALAAAACVPEGTNTAGIGGSGYVSSGSISGFGSVFVNGVEFETDSATFDVEGIPGTQDDLAIGMVVQVNGTINDDGITGTATSIRFDDQLQGPVTTLSPPDADGLTRTFTVLGVTVIVDSGSTTFDIDDDLPADTVFDFDDTLPGNVFANGNNIEISGFFDSNGNLKATRVELKDITFDPSSIVEVKGTISGLTGNSFNLDLGSLPVSLSVNASSATLEDLPNGLADGLFVEVKGTYASNTITASNIEAEDSEIEDNDEFEVEGLITEYTDNSNFKINGLPVNASNATFEPASAFSALAKDVRVEAEGAIVNGILIANEIELRGAGEARVHATITSVDAAANTFAVSPVDGEPAITVTITSSTKLEDDVSEIEPFAFTEANLLTKFVEVSGFDDGNGGITATEVKVKEAGDVIVQGIIQTGSGQTEGVVKVFGIEFIIHDPAETIFENASDMVISQFDFFNLVTLDSTLIKVKDEDAINGIADEIEIETP